MEAHPVGDDVTTGSGADVPVASLGRAARFALLGVLLLTFDLYVWRVSLLQDVAGAWLVLLAVRDLPDLPELGLPTRRWWQVLLGLTVVSELAILFGAVVVPVGAGPVVTEGNTLGVVLQVLGLVVTAGALLALTRAFPAAVTAPAVGASWALSRRLLWWLYVPLVALTALIGIVWSAAREELVVTAGGWALLLLVPLAIAFLTPPLHVALSLWRTARHAPVPPTTWWAKLPPR